MKIYQVQSDAVSLGVTEVGGHLSDVTFRFRDGRNVSPMHTAPWHDEPLPADTPPMMRMLRGDFFCAPFGASDVIGGDLHGPSANGHWSLTASEPDRIVVALDATILGATLTKHVSLHPGQTMVYERHTFTGGDGRIPVAHHAMLRAGHKLKLGFAPHRFAGTPPEAVEVPPAGRSLLAYPQEFTDLTSAEAADGRKVDLTTYPTEHGYEDVWMLSSEPNRPFAWTAATSAEEGWVWFSLKNPHVLPSTVVWMSNGGRNDAPWSGRHDRVIGLEEGCTYFGQGHAASIAPNPIADRGIATAVTLRPDAPLAISYAFGLAPVANTFGAVADVRAVERGVLLTDQHGAEVFSECDLSFVTADPV